MKTAKEVFIEVWNATFGDEEIEQLQIVLEHDYIFEAMESYADQWRRWIPVDENIPIGEWIFVRKGHYRPYAAKQIEKKIWIDDLGGHCNPTHWLPIPPMEDGK